MHRWLTPLPPRFNALKTFVPPPPCHGNRCPMPGGRAHPFTTVVTRFVGHGGPKRWFTCPVCHNTVEVHV